MKKNVWKALLVLLFCPKIVMATPVTLVNGKSAFEYSHDNRSIESVGTWVRPPSVVLCRGAPVSLAQVRSAIDWWTKRGYRFGIVIYDSIHYGCILGSSDGYIIIQLVPGDAYNEDYLATTSMKHDLVQRTMVSATINMKSEIRERVLEHELGHAMGLMHYNKSGHIMHKDLARGGWNDDLINLNIK
jgi:hypothetical protein